MSLEHQSGQRSPQRFLPGTLQRSDQVNRLHYWTMDMLKQGLVRHVDLDALSRQRLFSALGKASSAFVEDNSDIMRAFQNSWVRNPFEQWSRRYEYPFVFSSVLDAVNEILERDSRRAPLDLLDAGSGVSFFPFELEKAARGRVRIECLDSDVRLDAIFDSLKKRIEAPGISFRAGNLAQLPYPDASFDIVYCISVLEHCSEYKAIVAEFRRVLRPGGKLILTFDISVNGDADIPIPAFKELMSSIDAIGFRAESDLDWKTEIAFAGHKDVLSTRSITREDKHLLPWKHPRLVAIYKALRKGHLPRSLFRNLNCFCVVYRLTE